MTKLHDYSAGPSALRCAVLVLLAGTLTVPEFLLTGADHGLWGFPDWRGTAYRYGAFWSGLLEDWRPLFPLQAWLMFLTHGFLHAGAVHLSMNLVTLASLGLPILCALGPTRFLLLYAVAQATGGLSFALLGPTAVPMVGASGALFGLAGAWVASIASEVWDDTAAPVAVARAVMLPSLGLGLLNLGMYGILDGHLAWQTHLGGYVAGLLAAPLLTPRQRAEFLT